MSLFETIPVDFEPIQMRDAFVIWLSSQQITFHDRLRIYFRWLDYHKAGYTSDEIDALNVKEKIVEPESPL